MAYGSLVDVARGSSDAPVAGMTKPFSRLSGKQSSVLMSPCQNEGLFVYFPQAIAQRVRHCSFFLWATDLVGTHLYKVQFIGSPNILADETPCGDPTLSGV